MDTRVKPDLDGMLADKEALCRIVDALHEELGIPPDATATAERSRAMILADGVRPEDNLFSRGIVEAREE